VGAGNRETQLCPALWLSSRCLRPCRYGCCLCRNVRARDSVVMIFEMVEAGTMPSSISADIYTREPILFRHVCQREADLRKCGPSGRTIHLPKRNRAFGITTTSESADDASREAEVLRTLSLPARKQSKKCAAPPLHEWPVLYRAEVVGRVTLEEWEKAAAADEPSANIRDR